jgi:hypothetical protein
MSSADFLKVFRDKSELVHQDGRVDIFEEGPQNADAKKRYKDIQAALAGGFLTTKIAACAANPDGKKALGIDTHHEEILERLVSLVGSEYGRALVGLSILQLAVKTISPTQSIRLHKGGGKGAAVFSWKEGISMRVLDKGFITPALRSSELLKLNNDGVMMTRGLAENYPYSALYKASLRGGKKEWSEMVEEVEDGNLSPEKALQHIIYSLIEAKSRFGKTADETEAALDAFWKKNQNPDRSLIADLLCRHIEGSDNAARLMEIAMHSLFQAIEDLEGFGSLSVVPLSQMRSANKKHGNVGDIELVEGEDIIVSWDAKYGKAYLRDELEELADKLKDHPGVKEAGFVSSITLEREEELSARKDEMKDEFGAEISVLTLASWIDRYFAYAGGQDIGEVELAQAWLVAYVETLAQKRPTRAPIDEPSEIWLSELRDILSK